MKSSIVVLWFLLAVQFFGATKIPHTLLLLSLAVVLFFEISKKSVFKKYFVALFLGLFINAISCNYFRGQSVALTLRADTNFFYILFYFVLKKSNLPISKTENILFLLVLAFCVCYIFQFVIYPTAVFVSVEQSWMFAENEVRIRMIGQGLSSLGYFFGLTRFLRNKNKIYLLLSILCFGTIFLMGFRTMSAMIAICSLMTILYVKGFNWKLFFYGALLCGIFIGSLQIPVFAQKMDNMLRRQKTAVLSNKKYIRVQQYQYYTQKHFKNGVEYILGSGLPFIREEGASFMLEGKTSDYGRYVKKLLDKNINFADFGLFSMSWMIGIPAVLAMIAYSFRAYRLKVSPDYYYLKMWFLYLAASSFTTLEFCREGNFVVQAVALYLVEKAHNAYLCDRRISSRNNAANDRRHSPYEGVVKNFPPKGLQL